LNTKFLTFRKFKFYFIFILSALCLLQCNIGSAQDTIRFEVKDTLVKIKHSPTRAAMLSAVFPGMGQMYNKRYWKVGVLYAGMGTLVYFIGHFNNLYNDYLNAYIHYNKFGDISPLRNLENYKTIYKANPNFFNTKENVNRFLTIYKDNYRRYRDMDVLILAGVYLLNIIDATVDAYFFNYDISNNLSLKVQPALINNQAYSGATFGLKLCFSLN
jgi:hypothetical protein